MLSKGLSAVVVTDTHTNDPFAYVNPLVVAVLDRVGRYINICAGDDYYEALARAESQEQDFDVVIVFLRSRALFRHQGLFAGIRKPVVVVEHDAYQNSLEWHPSFQAWTRYFAENPVAALCVSGAQALSDLSGTIPGIVKRIPKGAPGRFLDISNTDTLGRYCIFGTVQFEVYEERKKVFDMVHPYTLFDRIIRKWNLYGVSYLASRTFRKAPDVSRISFAYPDMPSVLRYYSAAVLCDKGLREPMMKHFEVAALGLVPFRDTECVDELGEMGYLDGESMVVYEDVWELKEKMSFYASHRQCLERLKRNAREVTKDHTWERRAEDIVGFIAHEVV